MNLGGADAIHVASAHYFKCDELITRDAKILRNATVLGTIGIRVCVGSQTSNVPPHHRQGGLEL